MTWRRIGRMLLAAIVLAIVATGCTNDREEAQPPARKPTGKIVRDGDLVCYDGVLPQCYRIAPPEIEI